MSKKIRVLLICLVYISMALGILTGCGTKGPLYIPEQRYPQASIDKSDSEPKATDSTKSSTK